MTIFELRNKLCSFDEAKNQWSYSLIGPEGLDNIYEMLRTIKDIKGDFVETGVWKGGACIYAKALIDDMKLNREVYACDSFQGLPKPNVEKYLVDEHDCHFKEEYLKVSVEEVAENFKKCGVSTEGVTFVRGWFKDTMPILKDNLKDIAILRLDGDMYESTMVVLENLYDKVSDRGFVVIDDYCLPRAIAATDDFRKKRKIISPIIKVNHCIHYWRK